ncbi:MAG: serine/threonine-protein phosphatase [Gemmatimonadetes bacterium]|nr:serine/threonine-protein phosphatase [Gemmatimonadota bacterium]
MFESPTTPPPEDSAAATPSPDVLVGRRILLDMLPDSVPGAVGFDVAAGTMVGDAGPANTVWDAFPFGDGRTAFLVMEVKAPGHPRAHLLGMARAALRAAADGRGLADVLVRANGALAGVHTEGIDQFVDCAVVLPGDGTIEWSAAGKVPAGILGRDGTFHQLGSHGPPLGMLDGFRYGTEEATMGSGSSLLALAGGSMGLFRGAADLVAEVQEKTAGEVVGTVHRAVRRAHPDGSREVSVVFLRKH